MHVHICMMNSAYPHNFINRNKYLIYVLYFLIHLSMYNYKERFSVYVKLQMADLKI